jgi:hypothetical protein
MQTIAAATSEQQSKLKEARILELEIAAGSHQETMASVQATLDSAIKAHLFETQNLKQQVSVRSFQLTTSV